ncbi:MAG: enoyl-CoA hydratase-related protein [Acidimicrobiales bacterium]|nr:enoyl-CoA hydratase-related protein [Acidimicrobiales bacterium]
MPPLAVEVSVADRIATITLTSPPANALGVAVKEGLAAALDAAEAAGARVLVVRSAVDGFFAAGADLKLLAGADAVAFAEYVDGLRGVLERIAALPQLSIAAVDGFALGGGLELAMACTLRVASPRARLGVPEIKLGLLPGAAGTQRLPRLIGRGPALDLLLTGRSIGGEEGFRLGLVDRLAPDGETDAVARGLAAELAAGAFEALAAVARCADAARDLPFAQGLAVERREILRLFGTADAREGVRAFVEKRPPVFG